MWSYPTIGNRKFPTAGNLQKSHESKASAIVGGTLKCHIDFISLQCSIGEKDSE